MRIAAGLLIVLLGTTVIGQEVIKEPPVLVEPDMDSAALQGIWELEQLEIASKKVAADDLKKTRARVVIAGKSVTFLTDTDGKGTKGALTLDATQSPRWITIEDGKKGKEPGIYEIRGDTMKWCMARPGDKRPSEFASKAMPDSNLFVFKRVKVEEKKPEEKKDK